METVVVNACSQMLMHDACMCARLQVFWTVEAAREDPFKTDAFLWIDAGHQCNSPAQMTPTKMDKFNDYFDKMLITYVSLFCLILLHVCARARVWW